MKCGVLVCVHRAVPSLLLALSLWPLSIRAEDVDLTALASFAGTNGSSPWASVAEGSDGNLYGTTYAGGSSGHFYSDNQSAGTVFRVTPDGVLTSLCSFVGPNGSHPRGALIEGADGNLYGTTQEGGDCPDYGPFGSSFSSPGLGTIFRITTNGDLTSLVSFWGTNGSCPSTAMVRGPDGSMYGTTRYGGAFGYGTIFRLSTNGEFAVLDSFGLPGGPVSPMAPLILGSDGYLYGIAQGGSDFSGEDLVFQLDSLGSITRVGFVNQTNGFSHLAALCESRDGFLWGVSHFAGIYNRGCVWRMAKDGTQSTVCSFSISGNFAWGGVIEGTDGNLYGTRSADQDHPSGLVYSVSPNGGYRAVASLNFTNGAGPEAALVQGRDGNLYGTTIGGGIYADATGFSFGAVFRLRVLSAAAPKLRPPIKAASNLNLTWSSIPTRSYQMQSRTDFMSGDWDDLGAPTVASNRLATVSDPGPAAPQRYYRVILKP